MDAPKIVYLRTCKGPESVLGFRAFTLNFGRLELQARGEREHARVKRARDEAGRLRIGQLIRGRAELKRIAQSDAAGIRADFGVVEEVVGLSLNPQEPLF